jgi:two-component system, cell cycle sensor histidine kinase and response regulator CckA
MGGPMFTEFLDRFSRSEHDRGEPPLRVEAFRLICVAAFALATFGVIPTNLLVDVPLALHLATGALSLLGLFCYLRSRQGRHHVGLLFVGTLALLDVAWFLSAGPDGATTYFFFGFFPFALVMFNDWRRWALVAAVVANILGLYVVGELYPALVVPYSNEADRLFDHMGNVAISSLAVISVVGLILGSYHRERARLEDTTAKLRVGEERLRLSMAASAQGWFELNLRTGEGESSAEYVRMIGEDPATFRTSLQEWLGALHPEDRDAVMREFQACVTSGRVHTLEYRRRTRTGGWKWIRSVGMVVERDDDGRPARLCGTHADVTGRKELETQLLHSQRLEAVGTLASGVAHDLNNILTPIVMACGFLREKLTDPEDREMIASLEAGGQRGAAIIRQLLAFSRNLAQERVAVDLWQVARETTRLLRATLPPNITLVGPGDGAGFVQADATQLHQVVMNLGVNARDAMSGGGVLTVKVEREDRPTPPAGSEGLALRKRLVLTVTDTGCGMTPEVMARIFDPFFTTKPNGTGLGLASVHGIVKAHRGLVKVESEPGRGTTFRVFLPEATAQVGVEQRSSPDAPPAPGEVPGRAGRVLLVDDEPTILAVTSRRLVREGYEVLTAASGEEGLDRLRDAPVGVDLVITDFAMPGMDGPAFVAELRKADRTTPVIGVSGQDQSARAGELERLGFAQILAKPYEPGELLEAVRTHLRRGAGS